MRKYGGNGNKLAEVIVDYKKKDIKILDPHTRKPFKFTYMPSLSYFLTSLILTVILSFAFMIFDNYTISDNFWFIWAGLSLIIWELCILVPYLADKYHWFEQRFLWDYTSSKKVVFVKNIEDKIYKLPYDFCNMKLDYVCTGEFSKYLIKVHVFPKDYFIKNRHGLRRQVEDWEAWFYFSKIPKKGQLEIEFI